jgi:hypothetical protein
MLATCASMPVSATAKSALAITSGASRSAMPVTPARRPDAGPARTAASTAATTTAVAVRAIRIEGVPPGRDDLRRAARSGFLAGRETSVASSEAVLGEAAAAGTRLMIVFARTLSQVS